jgi:hypothetical protein
VTTKTSGAESGRDGSTSDQVTGFPLEELAAKLFSWLLGGDKKSQTKDIKRAKVFWSDYLKEMRDGKTR